MCCLLEIRGPRRGGLGETGVFLLMDNICTTQSQLCSVVSNYLVNSLGAQLNSKSVYGEVREEALQRFGKELPHPMFCTWRDTRKERHKIRVKGNPACDF